MLYMAFVKNRPHAGAGSVDMQAKSRKWWNEGGRPAGLKTVAFYGAIGSGTTAVIVFDAANHDDIRTMVNYWNEMEFEVHPALDMLEAFRKQGMKVA